MLRTASTSRLRLSALVGGLVLAVLLPGLPAEASATPVIDTVAPSVTHVGRTLTLTGSGLEDATSVTLNGLPLTEVATVPDGATLTAKVPAGATDGQIRVQTASSGDTLSATTVVVSPPPAAVVAKPYVVGDRVLTLSWTGGGTGPTVVRDVTGLAGTPTPASGRGIPVVGTTARDRAFTNIGNHSYAVFATDSDGTPGSPTIVEVTPAPIVRAALTLSASAYAVPYGRVFVIGGTLTRAGVAVANQPVQLRRRLGGSATTTIVRRLVTAANGSVRTTLGASRTADYHLTFAGDAFSSAAASLRRVVRVLPRITASFVPSTIVRGEPSVLTGVTTPALSGAAVRVQRRTGSSWQTVAVIRTNRVGTYRYPMAPGAGVYTYRALLSHTPVLMQALSPARVLRVELRDLVSGNSGQDVLALQRQLGGLRYDVGTLDGRYGYSVTHAVMAFQKVERLPVTGRWTRAERTRAGAPRGFRLRFASPARSVEISITRQVLVVAEAGRIIKIVDVSSGNNELYTVDGVTERATTPRGRFSITRKIDGVRVSRLGSLYRPAYFYQGWAVHGSPSVPAYAASHGCVRVINPAMDRLFPLLTVGTPVAVYDE